MTRLLVLLLIFATGCQATRVSVHYRSLIMEIGICCELEACTEQSVE